MQYHLRTLLILLALVPPLAAGVYWRVEAYRAQRMLDELAELIVVHIGDY